MDDVGKLIISEMKKYKKFVDEEMQDEIEILAKEIKSDLSSDSSIPERTGKYKKAFYIKKLADGLGYKRVAVANRIYNLTHLLENGHALKNGGRTKAFPHWEKAQQKAEELPERIARRVAK